MAAVAGLSNGIRMAIRKFVVAGSRKGALASDSRRC